MDTPCSSFFLTGGRGDQLSIRMERHPLFFLDPPRDRDRGRRGRGYVDPVSFSFLTDVGIDIARVLHPVLDFFRLIAYFGTAMKIVLLNLLAAPTYFFQVLQGFFSSLSFTPAGGGFSADVTGYLSAIPLWSLIGSLIGSFLIFLEFTFLYHTLKH